MKCIEESELDMMMCFGEHIFTILLYHVPKTFAKRILDLFLFVGEEMIFSILINMLKICQEKILTLDPEVTNYNLLLKALKDFFKKGMLL